MRVIYLFFIQSCLSFLSNDLHLTNSPTVGILTLDFWDDGDGTRKTQIKSSYLNWLEQHNIRWIEVNMYEPRDQWEPRLSLTDGLLLTGGAQFFNNDDGSKTQYIQQVEKLLEYFLERNSKGKKYPLWGTCLGFEALIIIMSNYSINRREVDNKFHGSSIQTLDVENTLFEKYFSVKEKSLLLKEGSLHYNHKWAFLMDEVLSNKVLMESFRMVGSSIARSGEKVLAMIEHKDLPIIGTQFHPEAAQFLYDRPDVDSHLEDFQRINRKFGFLFKQLLGKVKPKSYDEVQKLRRKFTVRIDKSKSLFAVFDRLMESI